MPVFLLAALVAGADPAAIPPTPVTLRPPAGTLAAALAAVAEQSGLAVDGPPDAERRPCPVAFENVPVWAALDRIAAATGTRITLRDQGRKVALAPGPAALSTVDGPFRVAVRQVRAVADLDTGQQATELLLDLHWEPRLAVVRVDGEPTVTVVEDVRGSRIAAAGSRTRTPTSGAVYPTAIRLSGVPRAAGKLTKVAGTITVTAAERMLLFRFPKPGAASSQEQDSVRVAVGPAVRVGGRVELRVDLIYPAGHPEFESFESFTGGNDARLVPTSGGPVWPADDSEVLGGGRRVAIVYRFAEDAKSGRRWDAAKWGLEVRTPGPLREVAVRFELRDVPLP